MQSYQGGRRVNGKEGGVIIEAEVVMLGFGDGRRGKEPRNASSSKSWMRKGNRFLQGFQEEHGPTDTWILVS